MEKEVIHIKIDQTKLRNELHFDVQRKTHAYIFDNRKKKDPKYKHKIFEE